MFKKSNGHTGYSKNYLAMELIPSIQANGNVQNRPTVWIV